MNMRRKMQWVLALALALGFARAGWAQDDPAALAPDDTQVFIRVDGIAALRADVADDPLIEYLRTHAPHRHHPEHWNAIQQAMGMSGDEIIDRYFGRTVGIIRQQANDRECPSMLVSRVEEADLAAIPDRLKLKWYNKIGKFTIYTTNDDRGCIAMSDRWLVLGDAWHINYITHVLDQVGQGTSLADDPTYRTWAARLPERCFAHLYANDPARKAVHVFGAERADNHGLSVHYVGESADFNDMFAKLGKAKRFDFGPLPADTIMAATFNLFDRRTDRQRLALLDHLIAPKTIADDVIPALSAPVVGFVGRLDEAQIEPNPGVDTPVVGVAIHMRDADVAASLDKLLNHGVMFANLMTMRLNLPAVALQRVHHGEGECTVADFGPVAAALAKKDHYRGMLRLAYGRIGSWYVLCTHEQFFRRCIDAAEGRSALKNLPQVKALKLDRVKQPIMAAMIHPTQLAGHMEAWLAFMKEQHPEALEQANGHVGEKKVARAMKGLDFMSGMLRHYNMMALELHRDKGRRVAGRIQLVRKPLRD